MQTPQVQSRIFYTVADSSTKIEKPIQIADFTVCNQSLHPKKIQGRTAVGAESAEHDVSSRVENMTCKNSSILHKAVQA